MIFEAEGSGLRRFFAAFRTASPHLCWKAPPQRRAVKDYRIPRAFGIIS
jgi:hypothetical protein